VKLTSTSAALQSYLERFQIYARKETFLNLKEAIPKLSLPESSKKLETRYVHLLQRQSDYNIKLLKLKKSDRK